MGDEGMVNHQEFDNRIRQAFALYNENWMSSLPTEEELESSVTFSAEFYRKMARLIRIQKKSYYYFVNTTGKRVASILLALLVALTATTFSVKALREPVIRFIIEVFEKMSTIEFEGGEDEDVEGPAITSFYVPSWIPDGFVVVREQRTNRSFQVDYQRDDQMIYFSQYLPYGSRVSIDTEGATISPILVNGFDGIHYFNKGLHVFMWGTNAHVFYLSGKLTKEELYAVAMSVKPEIPED
jgi:hypothetical protein